MKTCVASFVVVFSLLIYLILKITARNSEAQDTPVCIIVNVDRRLEKDSVAVDFVAYKYDNAQTLLNRLMANDIEYGDQPVTHAAYERKYSCLADWARPYLQRHCFWRVECKSTDANQWPCKRARIGLIFDCNGTETTPLLTSRDNFREENFAYNRSMTLAAFGFGTLVGFFSVIIVGIELFLVSIAKIW